jgi:flagellar biosynthesis protein FliR
MNAISYPLLLFSLCFMRSFVFLLMFGAVKRCLGTANTLSVAAALALWLTARQGQIDLQAPYVLLALREAVTGALVAYPLALLLESIATLGQLTDFLRGVNAAEQLAPLSGERESALEGLLSLGVVCAGCVLGGHIGLVAFLWGSYTVAPLGQLSFAVPTLENCLGFSARVLGKFWEGILGVALIVLLVELMSGVLGRLGGRTSPDVQALRLFLPLVALLVVLSRNDLAQQIAETVTRWLNLN